MSNIQLMSANSASVNKYDGFDNNGLYGGDMDVIAQFDELLIKLTEMYKKLRNILQEFNQKQQQLGWNLQVESLDKKREGIEYACKTALLTGGFQIFSGTIGVISTGLSEPFGEMATYLGQATSKGFEGAGQLTSAETTKMAEFYKVEGDFQAMNSQNYAKNIKDTWDKACQLSEQIRSINKDFVDLYARISSALVNK
ncbi:MAG TPA: hypothetical protein ACHBX0_07580 [Arsenophonus sp.]